MQFGRSYEEFEVGATYKHWPGKTVTEYDDHLFCLLTMNHHPLHLDAHYAGGDDAVRQERRRGQLRLLDPAGHVGPRHLRQGDRQPRDRVAAPRGPDLPRRHAVRRDHGPRQVGVEVQGRPGRRPRRDHRLQPGRQGGVHLPPQGDGAQEQLPRGARRRAARPPGARSRTRTGPALRQLPSSDANVASSGPVDGTFASVDGDTRPAGANARASGRIAEHQHHRDREAEPQRAGADQPGEHRAEQARRRS